MNTSQLDRSAHTDRPQKQPTRLDATRPDQTQPDQTHPGQTQAGQTHLSQTQPDQTQPDQTHLGQTQAGQPHLSQTQPDQTHLSQTQAGQTQAGQTHLGQTRPGPGNTTGPRPAALPASGPSISSTPPQRHRRINILPEGPTQARLPLVTIQQLDYLVAIAESPTWAAAAKRLQVSPSALSQGIAELERRIGLQLFERVGRRRVFATSSQPVLDYARNVIAQSNDLGRWIVEQSAGGSGQLRVGMIDAAALHYFSEALRGFRSDFPDVDLRLTVLPSGPLVEAMSQNELDLAVVVRPEVQPSDLEFTPIASDPLGIYAPEGSQGKKPQDWGPWVAFPKTSHTRSQIAAALKSLGAPFNVVAESNQPEVLSEMVRLGLGWAVLPILQAEVGPNPLRRATPEPLLYRPLVAVRRNNALPHPNAQELLRRLSR